MTIDEKLAFARRATERMAWYTHPFIASIVGVDDSSHLNPHVGSAVRLKSGDDRYLITAAHVLKTAVGRFGSAAVSAERGAPPYPLPPDANCIDDDLDVALFRLPASYRAHKIDFWPLRRTDSDDAKLATDFLLVHGFPKARSNVAAAGVFNRSLPYGVMLRDDDLPHDLRASQFAMDFDPANFVAPDGSDWVDPEGLSGSPVWRIGATAIRARDWTPERSRLVGVVTQWKPDQKVIVATKWEAIEKVLGRI
jgi:hypothetical protein